MSFENEKLTKFTSTILNDAKTLSDKILSEIEEERTKQLNRAKAEIESEFDRYTENELNKITSEAGVTLSKRAQDGKKQLAFCREKINSSILEKVRDRIVQFVDSDQYLSYLEKHLNIALDLSQDEGPFIIYARKCDIDVMKNLCAKNSKLENTSYRNIGIALGGFILSSHDQNKHVNVTLDTAFRELSDHIYEYIDLSYEE